ncbi:hypothetical protein CPC735_020360 [Coccidioides posadasii C735 delta SOWgp]|uniref:Uncharacterized protein n=2 Tax=Coccidioides posadasii TaxID=199306 RepID=E9DCG9_COCPS|nr:hypothetical protein CPC735_020360 [Coccidioides posadasii C735 delta SOWgp]EER23008.1 hypothetical protein CPC735_020360 [Coccidioides posadasii C735 delta SOWgp]EFW15894.1 conserved hypothetical protein [Coccidioides posadasii str. Silveira]|eukprot:XP_003065153.1 hypothetical protein CPC735_020360 [Coccidioides posadasii C735 delta SOWgp]
MASDLDRSLCRLQIRDSSESGSCISVAYSTGEFGDEMSSIHHDRPLSTLERVFSTHTPIFESFLLQAPTDTIFRLYHTCNYLRIFLRSYPTAWQYLSFRLLMPSATQVRPITAGTDGQAVQRQSRPYALDQLLSHVVIPFSPSLKSLDLDNTAVSGQNLISTVLNARRDTLEHLSVRGCKNVSLKYHIIPYLTMYGLQYDADMKSRSSSSPKVKHLALKSLYTYRCRHHRRRPYLTSSLLRRDSDSEPTHELVNLCHKLGIWTDTAWCTTPAGRCFRRRGYVSIRVSQGTPEVWVVFDRLWRSKNWIGSVSDAGEPPKRDGKLWEHDETGCYGEALGTRDGRSHGEGKTVPAHLRRSHRKFVENIKCDSCLEEIHERCEQCSVLMHCVGCRKTLCYSCAYNTPYLKEPGAEGDGPQPSFWWAPGATTSPCSMQEPSDSQNNANAPNNNNPQNGGPVPITYPSLKFRWCCTEPTFTGGGGISIGQGSRDVDRMRAAPLPKAQGWEDPEYSSNEWSKTFPTYAYGDPSRPDYTLAEGHVEMMRWLLGPPNHQASQCPRNLCQECYESPQWKVHCKACSRPLCMEHDLRGLRLRICGYRDLFMEKIAIDYSPAANAALAQGSERPPVPRPSSVPDLAANSLTQTNNNPTNTEPTSSQPRSSPQANGATEDKRPRNSATSSNNHTRASSPASAFCESPVRIEKWQGCQSFFCPEYRAAGDKRQRCTSVLNECTSCSVHVCQDCVRANPPCTCSFCMNKYLCPNCYLVVVRNGTCRRLEEERAKYLQRQRAGLEMLDVALERHIANEVAGFAGQFFGGLSTSSSQAGFDHIEHSGQFDIHTAPFLDQYDGVPQDDLQAQEYDFPFTHAPPLHPYDDEEIEQAESGSERTDLVPGGVS